MNRRGFLKVMLAAAAAPAIVRSENIMKIWTPSQEIITDPYAFAGDEYTLESWMQPITGVHAGMWYHVGITKNASGELVKYVNGEKVDDHPIIPQFNDTVVPMLRDKKIYMDTPNFDGYLNDIRFTKGVVRDAGGYVERLDDPSYGLYVGGKR